MMKLKKRNHHPLSSVLDWTSTATEGNSSGDDMLSFPQDEEEEQQQQKRRRKDNTGNDDKDEDDVSEMADHVPLTPPTRPRPSQAEESNEEEQEEEEEDKDGNDMEDRRKMWVRIFINRFNSEQLLEIFKYKGVKDRPSLKPEFTFHMNWIYCRDYLASALVYDLHVNPTIDKDASFVETTFNQDRYMSKHYTVEELKKCLEDHGVGDLVETLVRRNKVDGDVEMKSFLAEQLSARGMAPPPRDEGDMEITFSSKNAESVFTTETYKTIGNEYEKSFWEQRALSSSSSSSSSANVGGGVGNGNTKRKARKF